MALRLECAVTWRPASVSPDQAWRIFLADITPYLAHRLSHRTPGGRPILFLLDAQRWGNLWGGDQALRRQKLGELRQSAVNAGAAAPYLVALGTPDDAISAVNGFGFDGVSMYGFSAGDDANPRALPYSQLTDGEKWYWSTVAGRNVDLIPPVSAGWDFRPLSLYDPTDDPPTANWYEHPSPQQIVGQLDQAIQFVKAHPDLTTARSVLIYAWNELAEGGFLVPRLADGSARVDAIAAYLGKAIPASAPTLVPVVIPAIARAGSGCADGYGIWLLGSSFDPDCLIQLRSAQTGQEALVATYPNPGPRRLPGLPVAGLLPHRDHRARPLRRPRPPRLGPEPGQPLRSFAGHGEAGAVRPASGLLPHVDLLTLDRQGGGRGQEQVCDDGLEVVLDRLPVPAPLGRQRGLAFGIREVAESAQEQRLVDPVAIYRAWRTGIPRRPDGGAASLT